MIGDVEFLDDEETEFVTIKNSVGHSHCNVTVMKTSKDIYDNFINI